MKKLYFTTLALGLFTLTQSAFAQGGCTPNPPADSVGLYPKSLPDGVVGTAYDERIDFVMFKDSVLAGQAVYVCSFELMSVSNNPTGMNYVCGGPTLDATNNKKWIVNHTPGAQNYGCVRLFGTPGNTLTDDTLRLSVKLMLTTSAPTGPTCGGLLPYTTPQGLFWHIGAVGIDLISPKSIGMQIAPNPSQGIAKLSLNLQKSSKLNVEIHDVAGSKVAGVFDGQANEGKQEFEMNTANLAAGVYYVKATLDNKSTAIEKLLIAK